MLLHVCIKHETFQFLFTKIHEIRPPPPTQKKKKKKVHGHLQGTLSFKVNLSL